METGINAQLRELARELEVRRRVYPRWVAAGTVTPEVAELRIRLLEGAVETLRLCAESDRQRTFFD